MLFNTVAYFIFLAVVFSLYWLLPWRLRYLLLFVASYYFYMQWNAFYALLLAGVTLVSYIGGRLIESDEDAKKRRLVLFSCIIICLSVLSLFKYFNFFVQNMNYLLTMAHQPVLTWTSRLILPVGISFYTLQSLGYLIDVYRREVYAEKNLIKYALFVSFFPQLVAGPIERSKNLLTQLNTKKEFSMENLRRGALLILWGLFVKVVIADRAAIFVDAVYNQPSTYKGFFILMATLLFSVQIYCDFYGYSTIARGTALTLGIRLMDNFNAPYFSQSIKEFWRRWHVSLSSWFKDYLYIPLGGSRCRKERKWFNLMVVFGVSGLWHGASLSFVFWGLLNGLYQVLADWLAPLRKRGAALESKPMMKVLKTIITFFLITFAWLFFRANGFQKALSLLKSMLLEGNWHIFYDGSLFTLGITQPQFLVLLAAIVLLFVVDYQKYKQVDMVSVLLHQPLLIRVFVEVLLVCWLLVFGCYGELYDTASFIYFQF